MARQQTNQFQVSPTARQTGWGYITAPGGTSQVSVAVTFPTAFANPPNVVLGMLGYKTGATPTSVSEFNGQFTNMVYIFAVNVTSTGFTCRIHGSSNFGASFNGFTWIAEA